MKKELFELQITRVGKIAIFYPKYFRGKKNTPEDKFLTKSKCKSLHKYDK